MSRDVVLATAQVGGALLLASFPFIGIAVLVSASALRGHVAITTTPRWRVTWLAVYALAVTWTLVKAVATGDANPSLIGMLIAPAVLTATRWALPDFVLWAAAIGLTVSAVAAGIDVTAQQRLWRPMNSGEVVSTSHQGGVFILHDTQAALSITWRVPEASSVQLEFTASSRSGLDTPVRITPWYPGMSIETYHGLGRTIHLSEQPQTLLLAFAPWPDDVPRTSPNLTLVIQAIDPSSLPMTLASSPPLVTVDQGQADRVASRHIRASGSYHHPNLFAHSSVAVAAWVIMGSTRRWGLLAGVTALVTALLAGSRSAFAASSVLLLWPVLTSLLVVHEATKRQSRWIRWSLLMISLIAAVALAPTGARVLSTFEVVPRLDIWAAGLAGIAAHPLTGLESYAVAWEQYGAAQPHVTHAHNAVLELGVRYGVFGLGIAIIGIASIVPLVARSRRWPLVLVLFAVAVLQFVDNTIFFFPVLFATTLALMAPSRQPPRERDDDETTTSTLLARMGLRTRRARP